MSYLMTDCFVGSINFVGVMRMNNVFGVRWISSIKVRGHFRSIFFSFVCFLMHGKTLNLTHCMKQKKQINRKKYSIN